MSEPIVKPYTTLPSYADVAYVDGKLEVAAGIIARTEDPDLRRRWLETANILLDQRRALLELANTTPAEPHARIADTAEQEEA